MSFSYHRLTSVVLAVATWLALLPLSPLLQGVSHLFQAALVLVASGAIGSTLALLRSPRLVTLLAQIVGVGAVLAWRGVALAPTDTGVLEGLALLTNEGVQTIRGGVPPIAPTPGMVWLCLLLAALLILVLELLVSGLEQPAWSIAPLALVYGLSALIVRTDLSWLYTLPVLAGYLMVLLASTGLPSEATGRASNVPAYHVSRMGVGIGLGAAVLALALVVALIVPLGPKQPWNRVGSNGPIQLSDPTVRLDEDLRRPLDERVLTYSTSTGKPVYLRTVALPDLDAAGARLVPMRLARFGFADAYDGPGERVAVDVAMDVESEYLPVPYAVARVDAEGTWSYDPDTMAVVAAGQERTRQTVGLEYTVTSTMPSPSREDILAATVGSGVDSINLTVPSGLDPRVTQLTGAVVADAATAGEKALSIQSYLRSEQFRYTLDAPNSSSSDAISSFLLTDNAGYCIHFAAAMVTMARIEGIPARMGVGFTPGVAVGDGSFEVTAHDAHAWPELYFAELGWVQFEPTPAFDGPPEYTDPAGQAPPSPAPPSPSPSPTPSTVPGADPTPTPSIAPTTAPGGAGDGAGPFGVVVLVALVLLALLAVPALLRMLVRAWRLRSGQSSADAADGAWRETQALLRDFGRAMPPGSPGPAARAAAAELPPNAAGAMIAIGRAVEISRFSRDDTVTDNLPALVRTLRGSLAATADAAHKARARLLPASLLGRVD